MFKDLQGFSRIFAIGCLGLSRFFKDFQGFSRIFSIGCLGFSRIFKDFLDRMPWIFKEDYLENNLENLLREIPYKIT